jgi:hypothetical protein
VRRLPDPALGLSRRCSSPCAAAASSPCLVPSIAPPVLLVPCASGALGTVRGRAAASVPPRELRCSLGPSSRTLVLSGPSSRRSMSRAHSVPGAVRCSLPAPSSRRGALRYSLLHSYGARCSHLPGPSYRRGASGAPSSRAPVLPPPCSLLPARRIRCSLLQSSGL